MVLMCKNEVLENSISEVVKYVERNMIMIAYIQGKYGEDWRRIDENTRD